MAMRMLGRFLKPPIQSMYRYKARLAVSQLTSHESSKVKAVGNALRETLANTLSNQEKEAISSIEQRRSLLLKSDKQIPVIDYGAVTSNSTRTEEEMKIGVQATASLSKVCSASKPIFWATFLFKLIRKLEPVSCLELGSCVGISASYQAAALNINKKGRLLTLEGSPAIAKIAKDTLAGLGLENASVVTGAFHETLKGVFETARPIEFFFNDGHHDHDAVIRYFKDALPYLSEDAVIVFDDISWSPGMKKAWCEIQDDERVAVSIGLRTIGIAVMGTGAATKERFEIPLY